MNTLVKGRFFLLTGLSGSGKSTMGRLLVNYLNQFGVRPAYLMDGDAARAFFRDDLSFSVEERHAMTMRMAFAAMILTQNNIDVVMSNIAGAKATREALRSRFSDYFEIYLKVDVQTLIEHDVKGVYRQNLKNDNPMLVGVDIPYDVPENPEITIYPYKETPEESLQSIIAFLVNTGPTIGTKADTLNSLSGYLTVSKLLPQMVLTWKLISRDAENHFKRVRDVLGAGPFVLRSSCRGEDSRNTSNAGAFKSVLDVPNDATAFLGAARSVRDSYAAKGMQDPDEEQILIQPMLSNVSMSGVVCTRYNSSDSPYYVINYDELSGDTTVVTSGRGGRNVFISRFIKRADLGRWEHLIDAVRELERLFPKFPLEMEFVVTSGGEIFLLQCRPLMVSAHHISLEESAAELIQDLKFRFERYQMSLPHLPGQWTILSDMTDWNPSEIIGDRPSTLSYSLYRELVTDRTWHEARASQGYFDVVQANLMLSMARKPYIDARLSIASLTPASIEPGTRSKLVDHYLSYLVDNKLLHDKVEFDVVFTCYDLTTEKKLAERHGMTDQMIRELLPALKSLTNRLICGFPDDIADDYRHLSLLDQQLDDVTRSYHDKTQYWESFNAAYLLYEHTRRFGVLPFARLARMGFIARSLFYSLRERNLISDDFYSSFLSSVPTIAGEFSCDLQRMLRSDIATDDFMRKYGHLRMNTYDITSPRYDQMSEKIWESLRRIDDRKTEVCPIPTNMSEIDRALSAAGLEFSSEQLFEFVTRAIQAREDAKFRFTRALSAMLEYFAIGGRLLGFTREDLQYTTAAMLFRLRNPEYASPAKSSEFLRKKMNEKVKERNAFDLIKLPAVIAEPRDIEIVEFPAAKPNFITNKCITAPVVCLSLLVDPTAADIEGKIVVIRNADPGYDWIFSSSIAGLITKYGGVASHMAIRCAEFKLPGAIGCGELIYSHIEQASTVRLDCKAEVIHIL